MRFFIQILLLSSILFNLSCKSTQQIESPSKIIENTNTSMELIQKPIKMEDIKGKKLFWIQTIYKDSKTVTPKQRESYIVFQENSKLRINSDCNLGTATYNLKERVFSLGPIISTKRYCGEESTEKLLFGGLYNTAVIYQIENKIFFNSEDHSVSMEFEIAE